MPSPCQPSARSAGSSAALEAFSLLDFGIDVRHLGGPNLWLLGSFGSKLGEGLVALALL